MAKKALAKPAAKRKPRNTIVDAAPQIAELVKRMEAERARIISEMAAEEEAKKKQANPNVIAELVTPLPEVSPEMLKRLQDVLDSKDTVKSSSLWRRLMLVGAVVAGLAVSFGCGVWSAGGINVGPKPKNDAVAVVFRTQETEFRETLGEQVAKLRAGDFATEKDAEKWMSDTFGPKAEAAWNPLLEKHFTAYGGENWTAEKQAATIEGYAR